MTNCEISVFFQHGGQFVIRDGVMVYEKGTLEAGKWFDLDKVSKIEVLWAIWELGYSKCGPIYHKVKGREEYTEIGRDSDLTNYFVGLNNKDQVVIYVDSPCEDILDWTRLYEDERAAHNASANTKDVAEMCVNRVPKENVGSVVDKGKGKVLEQQDSDGNSSEEVENQSESEADTTDEEYDADLEDANGSDVDAVVELKSVREDRNKLRLESKRRKKTVLEEGSIRLGLVGIDKGMEKYVGEGNSYAEMLAGDEEYIDSSDCDSFASSEDGDSEEEHRRRRRVKVYYDPNCVEPLWELGMIFKNVEQFREAVVYYAVKKGVNLDYVQNEPKRVRMQCCYEGCPWVLLGSASMNSGEFRVKTYHPVHNCERQIKVIHCNKNFLAKYLEDDIRRNPRITLVMMQDIVRQKLEVYVSKTICSRAKAKVVKSLFGDYREEFSRLLDYKNCILETNPGSTCIVDVQKEGDPVQYIFKGDPMHFFQIP